MSTTLTVEVDLHIDRRKQGRKELRQGATPPPPPARVPRVVKLLALAHRFERVIRARTFTDYVEIAVVGRVTRARLSQIMSLLNLAPDIQEALLFLPRVERGRDPITLADLIPIARELEWKRQCRMWKTLRDESSRREEKRSLNVNLNVDPS